MRTRLFISHLPDTVTHSQLSEMFSQIGVVLNALIFPKLLGERPPYHKRAIVEMLTERDAEIAITKYHKSTIDSTTIKVKRATSVSQWRQDILLSATEVDILVSQLCLVLQETDPNVEVQIRKLLAVYGQDFLIRVLNETLEIEANGGLLINDGTRRRTIGGTFFYVAYGRKFQKGRRATLTAVQP